MAKYTTELRSICEVYAGLTESAGYNQIEEIIGKARTSIFDFNYPIFDPTHKETLETLFINEYYTREIGFETVGLFKQKLKAKFLKIMPYYNKLYESETLNVEPLLNKNYTITRNVKGETSSETEGTSKNTDSSSMASFNKGIDGNSETPNNYIPPLYGLVMNQEETAQVPKIGDTTTFLTDYQYANNQTNTNTKANGETESNSKGKAKNEANETIKHEGFEGNQNKMLQEYRKNILNIDRMIIEECKDLFMLLW